GLHEPRTSDIVWLDRDGDGALGLHVAQTHLGGVIRRTLVDTHRATVFTSATLAVAGSFDFAVDRFGVADLADTLAVGSPFDHRRQALLLLPADVALPGDVLRCVVIVRLPFSVPDDPLVQGRAERYDDPFRDFQLPQAALRLRQGFGRLIRTKTDYGAVVVLDRRISTKEYGEVLLASLPDARTEHVGLDGIGERVRAWCDRDP